MTQVGHVVVLHRPLAAKSVEHGLTRVLRSNLDDAIFVKRLPIDRVDVNLSESKIGSFHKFKSSPRPFQSVSRNLSVVISPKVVEPSLAQITYDEAIQ